jgi:hypothetical protein
MLEAEFRRVCNDPHKPVAPAERRQSCLGIHFRCAKTKPNTMANAAMPNTAFTEYKAMRTPTVKSRMGEMRERMDTT